MADFEPQPRRRSQWFDPHISLGNVLTLIGMAAGLIGLYVKSNATDVQHEQRLQYVEGRLEKVEVAAAADRRDVIARLDTISTQVTDVRLLIAAQSGAVPVPSERSRPARATAGQP